MTDNHGPNMSVKDVDGIAKEKSGKDDKGNTHYAMDLESVKSAAVVKYSAAEAPALYTRLQCNTNLNLPPSNWLSSSTETYGLQPSLLHRSGFSSFRIAHMFPDCIGQVDVISDAENVKKLLKIPYSRGSVSMMIHRIENTLLIDEFDVHKYLLREAESQWEWFKKFFSENIVQPVSKKDILMHHKNNSRNTLQQKNLASKFLYHSLVVAGTNEKKTDGGSQRVDPSAPIPLPYKSTNPSLPEPKLEEEVPDPTSNHKFSRNVVWTFEDIQMLLGTDMPIFGGGTHPCISLRLRDMTKPINVLTGMDYWLDNLMCNVPEVVMCYHLNGIVQKYELIKTEDLPHLENSKFSPKVIRDIAQNILSFLKANATKAGHTYWLFKGKDDDVVKLYDLTSLCTDVMDEKGQTPFTVPVAMLLYRVARNMKNSRDGRRQAATIRMLLQNCISLLSAEKYASIVTSAHYMIADLYIPADINPKSPQLVGDEEEPQLQQGSGSQSEFEDAKGNDFSVKSLSLLNLSEIQIDEAEYIPPSPPPIGSDIQTRCLDGIKHVVEGLHCLQFLNEMEGKEEQHADNQEPEMAKPFQTIPMPYQTLNQKPPEGKKKRKKKEQKSEESDKSILCEPKSDALTSWESSNLKAYTWNIHLKTLLYQKAYLIYATLSEKAYTDGKFGLWLRYIRMVLKIRKVLKFLRPDLYHDGVENYVLGPAGDALFLVDQNSSNMEMHNIDYLTTDEFDYEILAELSSMRLETPDENEALFPASLVNIEELLLCSCQCYKRALLFETDPSERNSLQRRLGNVQNELGAFYMNQVAAKYQELVKDDVEKCAQFKELCKKSLNHVEEGIRAFETVKDEANLALLHSNIGRLMRLRAHFHAPSNDEDDEDSRIELTGQERHFYNKAIASYQKALQILGERKYNPVIWDSVNWELSTALYSMASYLQDYPTCVKNQEEAEREVTEILHKALKYCDVETPGARQPVYQFRSAMIHHRLASLYHKSYRTHCEDENRRKKVLQLCKLHYEKSANELLYLEHPAEYLRVQLERVALAEFQAEGASSANGKIKRLENGLELLLEAKDIFKIMSEGETKGRGSDESKDQSIEENLRTGKKEEGEDAKEFENELNLLNFFEQRLQFILLSLTKLTIGKADGKKESSHPGQTYKKLYGTTLKKPVQGNDRVELAKWLYNLVSELSKTVNSNS